MARPPHEQSAARRGRLEPPAAGRRQDRGRSPHLVRQRPAPGRRDALGRVLRQGSAAHRAGGSGRSRGIDARDRGRRHRLPPGLGAGPRAAGPPGAVQRPVAAGAGRAAVLRHRQPRLRAEPLPRDPAVPRLRRAADRRSDPRRPRLAVRSVPAPRPSARGTAGRRPCTTPIERYLEHLAADSRSASSTRDQQSDPVLAGPQSGPRGVHCTPTLPWRCIGLHPKRSRSLNSLPGPTGHARNMGDPMGMFRPAMAGLLHEGPLRQYGRLWALAPARRRPQRRQDAYINTGSWTFSSSRTTSIWDNGDDFVCRDWITGKQFDSERSTISFSTASSTTRTSGSGGAKTTWACSASARAKNARAASAAGRATSATTSTSPSCIPFFRSGTRRSSRAARTIRSRNAVMRPRERIRLVPRSRRDLHAKVAEGPGATNGHTAPTSAPHQPPHQQNAAPRDAPQSSWREEPSPSARRGGFSRVA